MFGLCPFVGFQYAPRIADLADKNLYVPGKAADWPALAALIGVDGGRLDGDNELARS